MNYPSFPNLSYCIQFRETKRQWKISPYNNLPDDIKDDLEKAKLYAESHIEELPADSSDYFYFVQLWWTEKEKFKFHR